MNLEIDERIASELTRHAPVVDEQLAWELIESGALVRSRRRAIRMVAISIAAAVALIAGVALAPGLLARRADSPIVGEGSTSEVMRAHGEVLTLTDDGEGFGDLVAVHPGTGAKRVIVEHLDEVGSARWSADGRWVAYVRQGALWAVDASGEPRKIFDGPDEGEPLWSWSATGARIALLHDSTLSVVDVTAGRQTELVSTAGLAADVLTLDSVTSTPAWSRDDSTIVVGARGGAIHAIDVDTGGFALLVQLPGRNIDSVDALAWSPDGSRLGVLVDFMSFSPLFVVDADGSNVVEVARTTPNNDRIQEFAWSPDGSRIVYVIEGAAGLRIVLTSADGSTPPRARTITTGWPAEAGAPVWSPDGLQIAVGGRSRDLSADARNVVIDADASGEFAPLDDRTYESWRGGGYDGCSPYFGGFCR
jgi:Tol biopolymer transport system component